MKETDLSAPVMKLLEGMGYEVYTEVSWMGRAVDIVARRGNDLTAVELKLCLSRHVITQAHMMKSVTVESFVAVSTRPVPQGYELCERFGIGIITMTDGVASVLLAPADKSTRWGTTYADRMNAHLDGLKPGGVAGRPMQKGVGPAQECYDRVEAYREEHPSAKWEEIYKAVTNHYWGSGSMAGAMSVVGGKRERRRRADA